MNDVPSDTVDPESHSRHYSWAPSPEDPAERVHAGLDALERIIRGERHLSPGAHTLGLTLTAASEGTVTTSNPAIFAVAGLVPCAESGISIFVRCVSPRRPR